MVAKPVYLDVCALCRPYDDQSQIRIQLETNAINLILAYARQGKLSLAVSPAHFLEIENIPEQEERTQLLLLLDGLGKRIDGNMKPARKRAEELVAQGVGISDAAHVAFAELAHADFVSVDDRLLKKLRQLSLSNWHGSPTFYCDKEQLK